MNTRQKSVAFACGLIAVIMIAFPPLVAYSPGISEARSFAGYHFLFAAPSGTDIHIGMLMTQLVIVAGVFFTLLFYHRPRSDAEDKTGDPIGTTSEVTNTRH